MINNISPDANIIAGTFNADIDKIIEAILCTIDTVIPNLPIIYNIRTIKIKSNYFEYEGRSSGVLFLSCQNSY